MGKRKSKNIKQKDVATTYLSSMINKKIIGDKALQYIQSFKYENSYGNIIKLHEKLPPIYNSLMKNILLPKDIKLINNGIFGFSEDDLEAHLNESIAFMKIYNNEIQTFLKIKEEFEYNFLLGEYEVCENILNELVTNISYSNWYLYHMFLLKEYIDGFDSNFSYLKEVLISGAEHPVHGIFSFAFSRMVDKDLSVKNYKNYIDIEFYKLYNIPKDSKFRCFIESYIEPFEVFFYNNINDIFIGEEGCSIIDRYINLRKLMINLLHKDKELCKKSLVKILKFTDDPFFSKMHILLTGESTFIDSPSDESKSLFHSLDAYTIGDYEKCIILSSNHLLKYGLSIDIIEINLKSHINLNKELDVLRENSLFNEIILLIYNILIKNHLAVESLASLYTLSFSLHNFDIAIQLQYFVNKTINSSNYTFYKQVYPLFTRILTPKIVDEFTSPVKKNLLENFHEKYPLSPTLDFFSSLVDFELTNIFDSKKVKIPEDRVLLHLSKILLEKEMYSGVIENLKPLRGKLVNQPHLQEEYVKRMYKAHSKNLEIMNCVNLYIENYFINKHLLDNIDYVEEINFINNSGYKKLDICLDLILYLHICKASSIITPLVYRMFMRKIMIGQPSEISSDNFDIKKLVYFLKNVCVQSILSKDVMNFKNLNDVYLERVKICQLLIKIDSDNSAIYTDEIINITQTIKIKERMRDIDNSRIYVDIDGLKEYDLKDFGKNFSRFKKIRNLNDEASEEYFIMISDSNDENFEKKQNYKKKYVTHEEQLSKIFFELFMEVRDKYLFSNEHGLDSYLSTRIRHGTITGQLRKVFSELNLITTKDSKTNIYLNNTILIKQLNIEDKNLNKFNEIMSNFSNDIDEYITFIKNSFIQIKTEKHSEALFNFYIYDWFNQQILNYYYTNYARQIDTDEDFISFSIDICEIITDHNLEVIKKFFNENIKVHFINLLESLEKEIVTFDEKNFSPLLNAIRRSRTEIQTTIDTVSSWFERKKSRNVHFILNDVIDTTEEIINNLFPNVTLNIQKDVENNQVLGGQYFTSFVDCFKIFVENIIKYAMEQNTIQVDLIINIIDFDDYITCRVSNELIDTSDEALKEIDEIIEQKETEITNATNSVANRREDNTGIVKATKAIKIGLRNINNTLVFKREETKIIIEMKVHKKGLVHENIDS
ncbi:hypothetical protein DZA31_00800 [Arcobacter sp. HD9-500m-PIT-SAG02]|nr:hypothetical protein DZA31_00800 [Arcobacter sp. HD9-500m-PIT-SAG02]